MASDTLHNQKFQYAGDDVVVASGGSFVAESGATVTLAAATVTSLTATTMVGHLTIASNTAATGNIANNAAALPTAGGVYNVTGADNNTGVMIGTANGGNLCVIVNTVASKTLKIYPQTNQTINNGTANAAYVTAVGGALLMVPNTATNWITVPTTSS